MPKKILPRIDIVEVSDEPFKLRVRWTDGAENLIDLSGVIHAFTVFAPLRNDPDLFRQVHVGEHGTEEDGGCVGAQSQEAGHSSAAQGDRGDDSRARVLHLARHDRLAGRALARG